MATTEFMEAGSASTQDLSLWTGGSITGGAGTITSDAQSVLGSARSINSLCPNASNGLDQSYVVANGILADAGRRISVAIRLTAIPNSPLDIMGGANGNWYIGVDANGHLIILNQAFSVVATGTSVISINTDYRITIVYTITGVGVNSFSLLLNGAAEASATNINAGTGDTGFGCGLNSSLSSVASNSVTCYYAHIYVDNGTTGDVVPSGKQLHVTSKRPVSNGTTNGFTTQIGTGGSGYGTGHSPQVNERPLNTANGWSMVGAGSAVTEEYTIEGAGVGDINITGATIIDSMGWVYASALAAETADIIVKGVSSAISLTSTNTAFLAAAGSTVYPAGGTDVGIVTSTALTTVSLYECGVMVAYTPAVASSPAPLPLRRTLSVPPLMARILPVMLPALAYVQPTPALAIMSRRTYWQPPPLTPRHLSPLPALSYVPPPPIRNSSLYMLLGVGH